MALRLILREADAHLFVKLLKEHVPEMNARYPDEDVSFEIEGFSCEMGDGGIAVARSDDGWLYRMTIYIFHPKIYDSTFWESEERGYRAGKMSIEVTPLSPNIHAANIYVSIDYDPPDEAPEIVLLFLELFEPIENAWGGVMKQLGEQSAVLREAIEEEYGEERGMPAAEDISGIGEMAEESTGDAEATEGPYPEWFPKLWGRERWRKSYYEGILPARQEWEHVCDFEDEKRGHGPNNPPMEHFRTWLGEMEVWKKRTPSAKTVGYIIEAGDSGWLKQET